MKKFYIFFANVSFWPLGIPLGFLISGKYKKFILFSTIGFLTFLFYGPLFYFSFLILEFKVHLVFIFTLKLSILLYLIIHSLSTKEKTPGKKKLTKKQKIICAGLILFNLVIHLGFRPLQDLFWRNFELMSDSMAPNLIEGDEFFIHRIFNKNNIQKGDVIVFEMRDPSSGNVFNLVKRVIALPGNRVEIIPGRKLDEIYIDNKKIRQKKRNVSFFEENNGNSYLVLPKQKSIKNLKKITRLLSADEFFVMGDNRGLSKDSRHFGPIRFEQIIGGYGYTYLSYDQAKCRRDFSNLINSFQSVFNMTLPICKILNLRHQRMITIFSKA